MEMDSISLLHNKGVGRIIDLALAEDGASNDVTSKLVIPPDLEAAATLLAKAEGVLAGIDVFEAIFLKVDKKLQVEILKHDSSRLVHGDIAASIHGRARSILAAERTAMNMVCHLSGIATATARYVEMVAGTNAVIVDTRKTSPGQRVLEKYAVTCGGGRNHRMNLSDGILIKDNHIASLRRSGMSLGEIVRKAKAANKTGLRIEVEVNTPAEAEEAAGAGAEMLLLDNMSFEAMSHTVACMGKRVRFEASGGITLENVRAVAETGVDIISIGALTHSVRALDMSLEIA
jgi:nicotinate-nucleotide pyrophosphorylase (carboxylating)